MSASKCPVCRPDCREGAACTAASIRRRAAYALCVVPIGVVVAMFFLLIAFPSRAQSTPPGQAGFTACVGEVTSNPGGYLELRCSLAAEPGVAFEVWRYEGFSCGDVPEWTRAGVWGEGHPVELFVLRSCYDFAADAWVDPPDTRGRAAYRRLYVNPPDGPASSASSPLATSADIARVQALLEHGLAALLVVAGLWAFRFGVAAA